MLLQVSGRLEGLVAHVLGTLVGLLSGVRAQVTLQAVARGEGLSTGQDLTAVRSITCMCSLVHLHKDIRRHVSSQSDLYSYILILCIHASSS